MLRVENLSVYYGEYRAVSDLEFHVDRGELVTFIGANGAGKTSTIRAILGLAPRTTGRIILDGQDISGLPSHQRVQRGLSIVPEGRRVFPEMSVLQNLHMGAYVLREKARLARNLDWVFGLFPILRERQRQLAGRMSGGEQQMLAIGRALMSEPKLLLVDEISMGLMPIAVDKVIELISRLNAEGMTILLVEQNARKALNVARRGYVLESGRLTMSDTAENLRHDKAIIKAYLGG